MELRSLVEHGWKAVKEPTCYPCLAIVWCMQLVTLSVIQVAASNKDRVGMAAGKLGMCMATAMLAVMMPMATGSLPQTVTSALRTRATPSAPPPSHNISFGVPLALGSVGTTDGVSPPLVFTDNGTIAVVVSGAPGDPGACVRVSVCSFMRDPQRTHAQRHAACP